ncbi:MAG TPA: hypothetical protein VFW30_06520 [Bryocella sp.]|nr:hypothetical protein [Bryocella sp.]
MSEASTPSYLLGPEECEAFLSEFEAGSVPSAEWTHQAHIAMATVYVARYGDSVLPHTRAALRNHLLSRGKPISLYHETLTIFWLAVIAGAQREHRTATLHQAVCQNCARFGNKSKLHEQYYSYDVFNSPEARAHWMPPDLLPLAIPFPTHA